VLILKFKTEVPNFHPTDPTGVEPVAARSVAEDQLMSHPSNLAGHDVPIDYRKGFLLLPEG
jgi:hypothetical protein